MYVISVLSELDDRILLYPLLKMYLKVMPDVIVNVPPNHKLTRIIKYMKNEIAFDNLTITNLAKPTLEMIETIAPYAKPDQTVVILANEYATFADQVLLLNPSDIYPHYYDALNVKLADCQAVVQEIKFVKGKGANKGKKKDEEEVVDVDTIEEYWHVKGKTEQEITARSFQLGLVGTINKYPSLLDFEMVETSLEFYKIDAQFYKVLKETIKFEQAQFLEAQMMSYMTKQNHKLLKEILLKGGNADASSNNGRSVSGGKNEIMSRLSSLFLKTNKKVSKSDTE